VSTPWGVEFEENILVVVQNNFVVVLSDNNLDRVIVLLGNGLALDASLDVSTNKVVNKLGNGLDIESVVLAEGELLVLDCILDGESREAIGLQVQVSSVSTESLSVNGSEAELALVQCSQILKLLSELGALLWGLGKYVGQWNSGLENLINICVLVKS
jgi:hypothetical protein